MDCGDRESPDGVFQTSAFCASELHISEAFNAFRDDESAKSYVGIGNKKEKHKALRAGIASDTDH